MVLLVSVTVYLWFYSVCCECIYRIMKTEWFQNDKFGILKSVEGLIQKEELFRKFISDLLKMLIIIIVNEARSF